jgi:nicotinamidase/pyrazinamidase
MKALILVDIQNDFVEGGNLAVPDGLAVVGPANKLQPFYDLVVATQDWHPPGHGSFAANQPSKLPGEVIELAGLPQILWPVHCVQGTRGAEFVDGLQRDGWAAVFQKGTDPSIDSYSGFFDNGKRKATGLGDFLKARGVDEVHVLGLATDYCVKFTALDAQSLGFPTCLVVDASRGVNLQSGDVDRALDEMKTAGIRLMRMDEITKGVLP